MAPGMLFDADEYVAKSFFNYYHLPHVTYDKAIGLLNPEGNLVGAIFFSNYNGFNVELSFFGEGCFTLGVLRTLMRYCIATFDPSRLTVIVSKKRRHLVKSVQKLGCRLEGTQRCFYGRQDCNRNTGVRFVLFRDQIEKIAQINRQQAKNAQQ